MSRVKTSLGHKRIRRLIWLVLAVSVLLGYSLQSVAGSAYYSLVMQAQGTVSSPPVELQEGTAENSNSTIYANGTSAKVSVDSGWAWSDELLVNPGFEMGNLTGWTAKGPAAASVEVFNATSGGDSYTNRSLRIGNYGVCTKDQPGTNDDSGVWQNVSLSEYASAIDAGDAVMNASAWLYPSEWDWDDCALIVRFYNSSGGFISAWNTTGEYGNGSAYYPQAWMLGQGYSHFVQGQLKQFGCYNYPVPVGTRTVGIQLGMGEHKDPFYCGGQADEASIKISTYAGAGVTDVEDYVDNNTSDVDNSTDKGTHSNFTAQKYGPDLINDTLTEENVTVGYEYLWISGNDDFVTKLSKSDPETEILSWDTGTSSPFGCEHRIENGSEYIYVVDYGDGALIKFHANNGTEVTRWDISGYSGDAYGLAWNGSRWFIADWVDDLIYQVDPADPTVAERSFNYPGIYDCEGLAWDGSYLWAVDRNDGVYQIDIYGNIQTSWNFTPTDPTGVAYDPASGHLWITQREPQYLYEYYTNGTQINSWDPDGSLPQGIAYAYVEDDTYQLDLEVQWTNVDYDEPYEFLCIYGGTMSAENITIDIWYDSAWQTVFTNLTSGWNNVSVSSYLDSSNFTIRFRGGTEDFDYTQDAWDVDAVLLHVWNGNEVLDDATTVSTDANVRANSYGTQRAVLRTTDTNNTLHVFLIDNSSYLQWYNSTDGGQTWDKSFNSTLSANSFSVEKDSSNNIHLVYEASGNVEYRKQAYNATAWGSATTLDSSGYAHQPGITVAAYNQSWILVVFDVHRTSVQKTSEVHFARSTDGGSTWPETSTDITDLNPPGNLEYIVDFTAGTFPSIVSNNTLGTYGHIYVTWFSGNQYLYLRRGVLGSGGGVTWDVDDDVATLSSALSAANTTENTNMMHSAMYVNGKYRVVYCESGTANYRDWNESSWSSPISLAPISHYPSLTYDWNNHIYVFYQTNASNVNYDIRYVRSTDTTPTSFGSPQNVTADNNGNRYVSAKLGGDNNAVEFAWTNGTSPYGVRYNYITEGQGGGPGQSDFNYVLKFVEKHNSNWTVRLTAYDNSSTGRLDNCSIYIYNGSNSTQIVILNGDYENQTGQWIDLNASDTEYIWMHVETSSAGTSYIYTYLEIRMPNTTTYAQYIIAFEIT